MLHKRGELGKLMSSESVEVAKVSDVPIGKMKIVRAFDEDILLANVGGMIYAVSNRCGHQNAPLHKGNLEGSVVTCPLHAAQFDVTTGRNLRGPQLGLPPEMMQKLPQEMIQMFKRTAEILSEIQVEPLKSYNISVREESIVVEKKLS
jgi:nitrite reductase/ring-hydroxylating ferredoxin subunit